MALPRPEPGTPESVFTYAAPPLVFGRGAIADAVHAVRAHGRVLIVTDAGIRATGIADRVAEQVRASGCEASVFADVRVEPTDASIRAAIDAARATGPWEAFIAIGGGSSIDTAKAMNLMTTNPGELIDYVNAPLGGGRAPSVPLRPLIAVPTTTGTGSESTTVCVLDLVDRRVKTGISHPMLRPAMAVVDPDLTASQPPMVTACSGLDILCHALESYTARPFSGFEAKLPAERVPYCGSNPVSDMWAERALSLLARSFEAAVADGGDVRARGDLALAATIAGMGFGNAGVHVPHADAYPIAGRATAFRPDGYPRGSDPLVPHGMAVSLTAPEAFRLTFEASPERHLAAARLLHPAVPEVDLDADLPTALARTVRGVMDVVGMPSGLGEVGFGEADVPGLVEGALAQARLLDLAPVVVTAEDLAGIFRRSM